MRGEGRPRSDVDLVVVFPTVARAVRESFVFDAVPVEAFVYDRSSLRWFFHNDAANGAPSILSMVAEGVAIGDPAVAASLKAEADALLAAGPPPLAPDALARLRYEIGETLDDLRDDRPAPERNGGGRRALREAPARWRFAAAAPDRRRQMAAAPPRRSRPRARPPPSPPPFAHLFRDGDPAAALRLAEDELAAVGRGAVRGVSGGGGCRRGGWRGEGGWPAPFAPTRRLYEPPTSPAEP